MANIKQDVMASKDETQIIREQQIEKDLSSNKDQLQISLLTSTEKRESSEVSNVGLI